MEEIKEIDIDEVLRYLGYKGQAINAELENLIDKAAKECVSCAKMAYTYKLFPIECTEDSVKILNSDLFFESKDLAKMLAGCKTCAVLCATIGAAFDHRLNLLQAISPTEALIFNSCGSTLIEQVVDAVEAEILQKTGLKKQGYRFSPGYGDLDLATQKTVFQLLAPEKRTGITLSPSNMLIPVKSVSAILGLCETEKRIKQRNCATCKLKDKCEFRNGGKVCGHSGTY